MSCSTCDGYARVPNPSDLDGVNIDCPDCGAVDQQPLVCCPVHSKRVQLDGTCLSCAREAAQATAAIAARHVVKDDDVAVSA